MIFDMAELGCIQCRYAMYAKKILVCERQSFTFVRPWHARNLIRLVTVAWYSATPIKPITSFIPSLVQYQAFPRLNIKKLDWISLHRTTYRYSYKRESSWSKSTAFFAIPLREIESDTCHIRDKTHWGGSMRTTRLDIQSLRRHNYAPPTCFRKALFQV